MAVQADELVRAWKDPYQRRKQGASVTNPVGEVLLDDALDDVIGGVYTIDSGSGTSNSSTTLY